MTPSPAGGRLGWGLAAAPFADGVVVGAAGHRGRDFDVESDMIAGEIRYLRLIGILGWVMPLAGMCARRRTYFLFVSPKKSRQKKGDSTGRVPCASLRGSLRCSDMGRRCGTHFVATPRRSDNRSESEHEAWACCAAHARPTPCASRHGQRGGKEYPSGHRCARPRFFSLSRKRERACPGLDPGVGLRAVFRPPPLGDGRGGGHSSTTPQTDNFRQLPSARIRQLTNNDTLLQPLIRQELSYYR